MTLTDLGQAERRAFRNAYDDGLWDVLLACFLAGFALILLLSESLGDFWSSAILVPVVGGAYLLIKLVRSRLLVSRVGIVRVGDYRQRRLRTFMLLMLAVNVIALGGGLIAFLLSPSAGYAPTIMFMLIWLVLFSTAAYYLDTPRLYLYGLMFAAAVVIGEWLFREGYAAHHGWPVTFGVAAVVVASIGVTRFARLLARTHRAAPEAAGELHDQ
jgi:hypothetical protein